MTVLWADLVGVTLFAWAARYFAVRLPAAGGTVRIAPNRFLALAAAMSIILVAGLRNNIGDTFLYMHGYRTGVFEWSTILQQRDFGFAILQLLLKRITEDPQILVFVTALVTNALIVAVMYRYARLFELALFLYITSGAFIVSMNGIRQYLAAAIVFAATKFLLDGSLKRYIAVVLFASLFHQSALILIPIYFIVRRKAWTGATFALLAVAVVIVFAFNEMQNVIFSALKDTNYGHYDTFTEGGANVMRVVVDAIPLFIAYLGRDKLRQLEPRLDIFVNMSTISLALMIISTQNWIFARMTIYFSLYQIVLLSWIVFAFRKEDRRLVYLGILVFYLAFFFYENVITLGLDYRSDYLIW